MRIAGVIDDILKMPLGCLLLLVVMVFAFAEAAAPTPADDDDRDKWRLLGWWSLLLLVTLGESTFTWLTFALLFVTGDLVPILFAAGTGDGDCGFKSC